MEPFATVDDLLLTWPGKEMDEGEQDAAEQMLLSATAQLTLMLRKRGIAIDATDEAQAEVLKGATCAMVKDAMSVPEGGVASMQQTIGSTNASVSYSNPNGAFYLSRHWKGLLGLLPGGSGRVIHHAFADLSGGE